ncbi:MAG: cell envelope integrity protein TolA, partial [Myxococcota bacterium]
VRPPDPMEDDLTRLLDRADLFAEIAEEQEREGSPDGIEEGTEDMASAGDVYRGQLYVFFKRGWSLATTISDEDRRSLSVEATIEVADNGRITNFRLRGESGNPDFDQSVIDQLERLRRENLEIPEPPMLERDQWIGTPFTLHFRGRDAR